MSLELEIRQIRFSLLYRFNSHNAHRKELVHRKEQQIEWARLGKEAVPGRLVEIAHPPVFSRV